jgi:hypothetical protein
MYFRRKFSCTWPSAHCPTCIYISEGSSLATSLQHTAPHAYIFQKEVLLHLALSTLSHMHMYFRRKFSYTYNESASGLFDVIAIRPAAYE